VVAGKELQTLLEKTLAGFGYQLVDLEVSANGGLVRVFIDQSRGVTVEDCAAVSNHLTRLLAVEGIDYARLEVSSPGLDRPLKRTEDFTRYQGERVRVRMRVPVQGRRNFLGVLRGASESEIQLEVDGALVSLDRAMMEKARLVPTYSGEHR
jgi:ribosome maturation factor RimP